MPALNLGRFDRIVLATLLGLGLFSAGMVIAGRVAGARQPVAISPASSIGMRGPFELRFEEEMQTESVQERFIVEPSRRGKFVWQGSTLRFWPSAPLQEGVTYHVTLLPGARSAEGREIKQSAAWDFTTRLPAVVFLHPVESPEIWEWEEQGDSLRQLTQTGGKVFDYDVSTSGDNILFSVFNAQEGIDLWLFSRADGSMEQLLDCGRDWCSSPAWSPWDDKIAYARRIAGKEGAPPDTPRVYVLEMASRIDRILYGSENVAGYAPEWSPDGRYLAFFDTRAGGIRIFDLETGKASILQTQSGLMGAWSPDSGQLAFTNFQQGVSGRPYSAVYFFAPQTQTLERFSPAEGSQLDYSVPAWSPDGNWLALALQPSGSSPSKQIWLMRPDASDAEAVTSDEGFTHAGYQFSPDGESLVFQRISLSASRARPELLRWERGSGQVYTISEDAALPSWLP